MGVSLKMRRRNRVAKTERIAATPETKAKLENDPLRDLIDRGLVDTAAENAANEIRMVYLAIVREAMIGIGRYGEYVQGRYEISDELAAIHSQRYKPWADTQGHRLEQVIDLVVDRRSIPPFLVEGTVRALDGYARMMRFPLDISDAG